MKIKVSIVALLTLWVALPGNAAEPVSPTIKNFEQVSPELAEQKRCLSCHAGIETINALMAASWGADTQCEVCHQGNPTAATKGEAHRGLIAHPGDLRVIRQTCGQCHDDAGTIRRDVEGLIPSVVRLSRAVSRGERNHGARVLRSTMSTAAGEIAATRYLWGAQEGTEPVYGVRPVEAVAGMPAEPNTVKALRQLPAADQSDADNLLRNECLKCHLWTRGESSAGLYRAGGCDACHVLYADDGLSRSSDPTTPKAAPGHPVTHEITVKVPSSQCLHCHNRHGNQIGLSYSGLSATQGSVPYQADGTPQAPKYGGNYQQTWPDVHGAGGMECIDCHTSTDVHGTGALFVSKNSAVAIDCESCHGNLTTPPTRTDRRNQPLVNLTSHGQELVLHGKVSGQQWTVLQVDKLLARDALPLAMRIPAHLQEQYDTQGVKQKNRLECYGCHASTAPQYYGFQFRRDDRTMAAVDWVVGIGEGTDPLVSPGAWTVDFTYQRLENPVLGINHKGRVCTLIPEYQAFFTRITETGQTPALNQVVKTKGGKNGLAFAAVQPHTVRRQALRCEYCHANPKAVGRGEAGLFIWGPGWTIENPLERVVDEHGRPLQEMARPGSRPFTKAEMDRIDRLNLCLACHQTMENPDIWKQVTDGYGLAKTNQQHKGILETMFNRALTSTTSTPRQTP